MQTVQGVKRTAPAIKEMLVQRMAVIVATGDPKVVGPQTMATLYDALFRFIEEEPHDFVVPIRPIRVRWPDAHLVPRSHWTGRWGLPIPGEILELPSADPLVAISIEDWEYGTVAEILHRGPFKTAYEDVERLHDFVLAEGFVVAGPHEEEYLTVPGGADPAMLIRYSIEQD